MILAVLLFISGIAISVVAEYYSIMGLMAIFSAAPIPIAVMGIALGIGKLVQATWLKAYWPRLPATMKLYGVLSVCILMLITTLGCFGFLSKAHSDQTLVSGDSQAKVAIYDEKIKTAKDNIDANRRAIKQMDEAVDQVMGRSNDEKGADKAVAIRRSQTKERARLLGEIENEQRNVARLSEERAPYAAEFRKMESEVGPIKYIAAFIYGDNPDANILERAVTWVIVLIVIVFDPLAVVMLLASQMTWNWYKNPREDKHDYDDFVAAMHERTIDQMIEQEDHIPNDELEQTDESGSASSPPAYLSEPFEHFKNLAPMPAPRPEPEPKLETTPFDPVPDAEDKTLIVDDAETERLQAELNEANGNVFELANYVQNLQQDYAVVTGLHQKSMTREAELIEELAQLKAALDDQAAMSIDPEPEGVEMRAFTEEEIMSMDDGVDETAFLERFQENLDRGHEPTVDERLAVGEAVSITEMPADFREMISKGIQSGELVITGAAEPVAEVQEDSASEAVLAPISQPEILTLGVDVTDRPGDYITDPVANLFTKREPATGYGDTFPDNPERGDLFLRTDLRPTRLFKWNNVKWIEVNKATTDAYTYNDAYIQFLAEKLMTGEYTQDDLTETEQVQVQSVLGGRYGRF
jgi:hypothetical protein